VRHTMAPLALELSTRSSPVGSELRSRKAQHHSEAALTSSGSSTSVGSAVTLASSLSSNQSLSSFSCDRSRDATVGRKCNDRAPRPSWEFRRYRHGGLPYKSGWLSIRESGNVLKKSVDRFVELAGPYLVSSASPNTDICGKRFQIYGAMLTSDAVTSACRINIRTVHGERLTLLAESRDDFDEWLRELTLATSRHINTDYEFMQFLGSTIFGRAAVARDVKAGSAVTVRMTRKDHVEDRFIAQARREAMNLLLFAPHPAIASVLDFYETPSHNYCVTEFVAPGSSIRDVVMGRRPLSERDASYIMQSLLQALSHIHAAKIIHRACSPDSVHMVSTEQAERGIKLTSFEFALSPCDGPRDILPMMDVVTHQGLSGPLTNNLAPFLAPEVASGRLGNHLQDSWSAGIIMHYMLVARTPFDGSGKTPEMALQTIKVARGMPRFLGVMWDGISADARDLCAKLLHADPRRRLSPTQALRHPWFRFN
jgi:Protein kinase domain